MKKLIYIFLLFVTTAVFSQNNGITYQAVIYMPGGQNAPGVNVSNVPMTNKNICLQFSLLDANNRLEYQEEVKVKTDEFGMVNITIGNGVQSGGYASSYAAIVWNALSQKNLHVAFDSTGLCNQFDPLSNEPINSIPFANAAITAGNVTGVVALVNGGTGATTAAGARANLGIGNIDNTSDLDKPISTATKNYVDNQLASGTIVDADATTKGKIQLAGDLAGTAGAPTVPGLALKENAANKSTTTTLGTSNVLFPTQNAVKTYVDTAIAGATIVDADAATKGKIQLAGDLAGTAGAPTVPGLALKENAANKSTTTTLGTSNVLFPTQNAVKTYVDTAIAGATIADADAATKGKIQLSGDLAGTAGAPTVPGLTLKENVANKSTNIVADAASTTKYPSVKVIKDYVDALNAAAGVADGSITSAKIADATIVNADVAANAQIDFNKLNIQKSNILSLGIVKGDLGLGNVDNTSDAAKPVSTATQAALDLKANMVDLAAEVTRATAAETTLTTNLATEATTARAAELANSNAITAEATTARAAEATLTTNVTANATAIAAETTRATAAETTLTTNLATEATTARAAELANATAITTEATTARAAEATLTTNVTANATAIAAETTRATAAETTLTTNLAAEATTARAAELANATAITTEATTARAAEATLTTNVTTNATAIAAETTRATAAETTLTTNLAAEATTARAAELANATAITTEATTARAAEATLTTNVTANTTAIALKENAANKSTAVDLGNSTPSDILFPSQAAVKAYVDSSVSSGAPDATTTTAGKIKLAGDLTGTAALPEVAAGAISTAKLAANAVTTVKIADASVTKAKLADDAVETAKIKDLNVTVDKLAANAVTTAKILDGTILVGDLADAAVETIKIKDANVTTAKLADAAVETAKIKDANVTTAKLADAAVETAKIKDANVTNAKLDKANIPLSGFGAAAADVDLGSYKLTNVTDPTTAQDAATKNYVDTATSGITTLADGKIYLGNASNVATEVTPTGDVTMTNAGVTAIGIGKVVVGMLATDAVEEAKIKDAAVTTAKITDANVTAAKLATDAVETAKIKDLNVTVDKLAANAVTTAKILDGTILVGDLADAAVETIKIKDANVTTAKLADAAVETAKIKDANVTTAKLADAAVETAKIKDAAVETAKIKDANVTNAKLDKANIPLSGFGAAAADVDLGSYKLTNVTDPTTAQDAATKNYVDTATSGITTLADGKIYLGNASNVATEVTPTGDVTITNAGVTAIGTSKVVTAMLATDAVTTAKITNANVTTAKLADDAVETAKIKNANVTNAKLATGIDAAKLADGSVTNIELQYIGTLTSDAQTQIDALSTTSSTNTTAITAINTLAAGKIYLGNASNEATEVTPTGDVTMTNAGVTAIGTGKVVVGMLATDAVEEAKIKDAAVTTAKIADVNVTAAKLADAAVTTAKITDANVTAAKLATDAVETAKIKDAAVETAKIKDANVTYAKIQNVATGKVLGRVSANAGVVEEIATTGTGDVVRATSPTLVTPVLGAATGTSLSVTGQLTSTVAIGTAPLVVTSTTPVANLSIGGNAATATKSTNIDGGSLGSVPYQSAAGTTSLLAGNTTTTVKYLTSTGDGTAAAAPTWTTISAVPYTGATGAVNLGAYDLTVNGLTIGLGAGAKTSNTTVGKSALVANTSGTANTSFGAFALNANTTGLSNTAFGNSTLQNNVSGEYNTAVGANALVQATGTGNTAIGYNSQAPSVANSGTYNTSLGYNSLQAITSGYKNTALGSSAMYGLTTGNHNIAIGDSAGATVYATTSAKTGGQFGIYIGYRASPLADSANNEIVIGSSTTTNGNNTGLGANSTVLGNSSTQQTKIYGTLTVSPNTAGTSIAGLSTTIAAQTAGIGNDNPGGSVNLTAGNGNGAGAGGNIVLTPGTSSTAANKGKVNVNGQIKIIDGTQAAGKVLTSDATGLATWASIPSTNLTTGVTGILPEANGGTGSATKNFVDLTSDQTVAGAKTFSGNTSVGGTLAVTGATTLSSTLAVTGNTTVGGTTTLNGNTSISDAKTFTVGTGATTLGGTLAATGAATLSSTLAVTGNTTVGGTLGVTGNTTIGGTTTLNGNTSVSGSKTFTVGTGATTLGGTLAVTDATTLSGTLGVTGATTLSSTLDVTGNTVVSGTLKVAGGSPGAGKVLVSDASGLASWSSNSNGGASLISATATMAATATYNLIVFSGSATSQTITLPSATDAGAGREITIKNIASVPVTVNATAGNLISDSTTTGATSLSIGIEPSNNWIKAISTGSNWIILRALF